MQPPPFTFAVGASCSWQARRKTEKLFAGQHVGAFVGIKDKAERKLAMLDVATALEHLSALPGNRLEALKGDRAGQHSIRIDKPTFGRRRSRPRERTRCGEVRAAG